MSRRSASAARARRRDYLATLAAFAAGAAIVLAVVGGGGSEPLPRRDVPRRPVSVGSGARSALVLPARSGGRLPTVVFLHGWGLTGREAYRAWLRHLTAGGSDVIVPRYQASLRTRSASVPDYAIAGVRGALRRLRPRPRAVVVVGHSVGGILAVDYAARARELGLPPAVAVMSVFPGTALRDMSAIPHANPAKLPSTVRRLLVLASSVDTVVGTAPAEAIYHGAANVPEGRRDLVTIDDSVAGNHFAPVLDSPAARRSFWSALDRLLRSASGAEPRRGRG